MPIQFRRGALIGLVLAVLVPSSAGAQDVTVRGSRLSPASRDEAAASSQIRGSALEGAGLSTPEVLRRETGVTVTETGGYGALSTAAIRGATAAQTSVFLAGLRLNDDLTGDADLSRVPLWMIGRIEVYRGAVPLEADPWGVGGAIFFDPRVPKRTEASAAATVGSFGTRALEGRVAIGDDRAAVLVGLRAAHAKNDYKFVDDRGTRFDTSDDVEKRRANSDVDDLDMWALGRFRLGERTRAVLTSNELTREQGVPGLAVAEAMATRSKTRRSLHGLELAHQCGEGCSFTGTAGYVRTSSAYDDPLLELAGGKRRSLLEGIRGEASSRLELRGGPFDGGLQLRLSREELTTSAFTLGRTEEVRRRDGARVAARGGVQSEVFGHATVMGSFERQGTSGGDADDTRTYGAVRFALTRPIGVGVASLNLGSYYRAPTLGELYGYSGVVRGNGALLPERGRMIDVGVRLTRLPSIRATSGKTLLRTELAGFLFARDATDLVAFRRSSLGYVTPYNLGSARAQGAELEMRAELWERATIGGGLTFFDGRDTSRTTGNDLLPFRPRFKSSLLAEARMDGPAWLGVKTTTLSCVHVYESSRYADPEGLIVIPAQATLDAALTIAFVGDHTSFDFRIRNLLDAQRFDTVGFVLPGRAFFATMEVFL
ncbi:outer membrane protein, TonB dependent [Labilithrix luteola]|uniref:Outer membrane protein, TonB dependent n=1 Tax=Labilithrix luteola TaxID=1391654 RepID=A0A0K1Q8W0_9BACT|nr:TonB-dependent receptor [Labilithrix luteola]AKV02211.1 outer membrane protein, TonB dependent [Labilithrix luteola]